ncbi:hypothetical protein ACH4LK_27185 [Streptomyces lydicus]|uniref:hypothetical protein n=1 Tax=Streptomyces lydicus TaxID=47763 RepID=UPI00379965CA
MTGSGRRGRRRPWDAYAVVATGAVLTVVPLLDMLLTSFKGPGEFGKLPFRFLPQAFGLSNYRTALYQLNLPLLFRNSVVATVVITGSTLVTSALTGYALAICWGAAAPASPSASPLSSCRSWCPDSGSS